MTKLQNNNKLKLKVGIVTISDRASQGTYEDLSGPALKEALTEFLSEHEVEYDLKIIADEAAQIKSTLENFIAKDVDFIFTTGGTGLGPRDLTPEVTKEVVEKELPGIAESLRAHSLQFTKNAMLSRATAGLKNNTLIVNLPGSPKAVKQMIFYLGPTLVHAYYMIRGIDAHKN
ncbi:MAG: molybdopterin adenylyltransferase [Pseudomonadota bacterium]